jgi:hypothetical protein
MRSDHPEQPLQSEQPSTTITSAQNGFFGATGTSPLIGSVRRSHRENLGRIKDTLIEAVQYDGAGGTIAGLPQPGGERPNMP